MYFTRALDSAFTGGDTRFLAAYSPSDTIDNHREHNTAFRITLAATDSAAVTAGGTDTTAVDGAVVEQEVDMSKWFRIHGWLAVTSWGALLPSGVIFARRLRDIGPIWCAPQRFCVCLSCRTVTVCVCLSGVERLPFACVRRVERLLFACVYPAAVLHRTVTVCICLLEEGISTRLAWNTFPRLHVFHRVERLASSRCRCRRGPARCPRIPIAEQYRYPCKPNVEHGSPTRDSRTEACAPSCECNF